MINEMNARAQEIFRLIVDEYLASGEPVGSRTLSRIMGTQLSPASIRNVMADLEDLGLLYSPHTSAGRMPTEHGLRFFVDALMEVGQLHANEKATIDKLGNRSNPNLAGMFEEAGKIVSGLSACTAVVVTPKLDRAIRQIQFLPLGEGRTIAILVFIDGSVENRILNLPPDLPQASLIAAGNYINARIAGQTLGLARARILDEIRENRTQLDALSTRVVEEGLAIPDETTGNFFVRGTAKLLEDVKAVENLEAIQQLIDTLDRQETMAKLLEAAQEGEGVRIFIGSENRLFGNAGLSMVVAPARNARQQMVGAVGVIGPTRMSYGRVVPIVDYTSQVIARLVG
ncbi:MAG: heat-inducible transcriptional repressor HrcA [Alphaproteobacteria bacterium]|nr:heat-inducible transcriptional repressor HrcA [Alphaproteobacteria bacterium]